MPLREIFRASEPSDVEAAQRRLMLAQAMQQRAMQPNVPAQNGPVASQYAPSNALVDLAAALTSAYNVKKSGQAYDRARAAQGEKIGSAMQDLQTATPDAQVGAQSLENLRRSGADELPATVTSKSQAQGNLAAAIGPGAQEQIAAAMLSQSMAAPKYERQDLGDAIGLMDERGNVVRRIPKGASPQGQTADELNYAAAVKQGFKGTIFDYQRQLAEARAQGAPVNLQNADRPTAGGGTQPGVFNPRTGAFQPQGDAVPKPPKDRTEGDKKNAVLYDSITNAEKQIAELEKSGDVTDTSSIGNRALGSTSVTKPLQSDAFRKYESAALRWSANLLYLKSGATATPEEVESTRKQFFPQPGDGPDVKAQKAEARKQELESVRANMVPNAPKPADTGPPSVTKTVNGKKYVQQNGQWYEDDGT